MGIELLHVDRRFRSYVGTEMTEKVPLGTQSGVGRDGVKIRGRN